jgi:hypothetical protein
VRTVIRWLQVSACGPGGEGKGVGAALTVAEVCPGSLQSALAGAAPRPARQTTAVVTSIAPCGLISAIIVQLIAFVLFLGRCVG